ncbi:MAG: membrane protease YdiL (CAAX protease family) [Pirellulaceae bacterium]|jgi:membrane protease YdiL (CAAX protease family)
MTDHKPTYATISGNSSQLPAANAGIMAYKPAIILGSSIVLMLVWKNFGTVEFYLNSIAAVGQDARSQSNAAVYQFVSCLVLLGVIPSLIVTLVFRERLVDYGVGLGNRLLTIRSFLIAAPAFAFFGYLSTMAPGMDEAFPINKQAGTTTTLWFHACTYALFYLGWEFHFRGFLQFGLADSMGRPSALLVQVVASSLLHIGQPLTESIAAIAGALLWGWLAYRTKSILSGMLQHILLGLVVDAAIIFS